MKNSVSGSINSDNSNNQGVLVLDHGGDDSTIFIAAASTPSKLKFLKDLHTKLESLFRDSPDLESENCDEQLHQ